MFSGSVCFKETFSLSYSSLGQYDLPDLTFRSVRDKGFEGVCYLHPRLPYGFEDIYYCDDARDVMVLLSGVIYNKHEFLQSHEGDAQVSDPEMIAGLFLRHGPEFVTELNGDFAIFIMRPLQKEAFLFRDHIGIRPLAWTVDKNALIFSTHITNLCRAFQSETTIDSEFLLGYFKYTDYRRTPNRKIRKLTPGHFLHYSSTGIEIKRYWHPEEINIDRKLTYEKMLSDLEELVRDAVRIRSDKRFTAGSHVSSGIDSGIIAALAREEYKHQESFCGFSWSPAYFNRGDLKIDERDKIITACEKTGINPVFSYLNKPRFLQFIEDYYYNLGYYSEAMVAEQAASLGTNLIFTGWGGDEFISTGHSGVDLDLLRRLKLRAFFRRNTITKPGKFIKRLLFYVIYPLFHILDPGNARAFRDDARYIRKPFKKSDRQAISSFYFHRSRRQMHLNVLRFYNLPERCESWHMLGFRKGLEYRYPLLDKRIVEYMLKVPSELLCKTNYFRPLLREISEGILPDEIRLNESKNDPVYWTYWDELIKSSGLSFMDEVEIWRANPNLHFVDFELLSQDFERYKGSIGEEGKILFRTLVYLKGIHEFILKYH